VSEETHQISIAVDGDLHSDIPKAEFRARLAEHLHS